jgi:uncharacterized protein (TIGR03086 family)
MATVEDRTSGSATTLDAAAIETLKAGLRGQVIARGDADYEVARRVHNGMIERHPRLIVRCRDVADVISSVNFGRAAGLDIAVRGGAHNAAGLGTVDDGLVVDLSLMRGVRVDPAARTVQVEGGAVWGDVDHATNIFGLATPSGFISTTGVGGLTLGGGIGNLTRGYGLSIDNLLAVDAVLADGSFVSASADQNPDLFWAVRGGGGNFGIVTSFVFRLHPIGSAGTVYGGPMLWPMEQAADIMRWWRDFVRNAPETLGGWFAFLKVPPGPPFPTEFHTRTMVGIVWTYTGPVEEGEAVFAPIRREHPAAIDFVGPLPFPALQSMFDGLVPHGIQSYWRADFLNEIGDDAIARHIEHANRLPTLQSTMHIYPVDGAAHRVGPHDTAFSYRDANFAEVIVGFSPDAADADRLKSWVAEYWDAVHPYSAGGAYVNFMMDEGVDRIRATYRDNYDRLAQIKRKYDPDNLFHVNQNIKPAAVASMTTGELYVRAMAATRAYIDAVRPEQWTDPTPCTEWNVRQIANHIIGENLWAVELLEGRTIAEVGNRLDGDLAGADAAGAYAASVRSASLACTAPGAMEATCHLSFGDYSGSDYAAQLFMDMLIHGWDIAKATGQDTRLDPEMVEACLPIAEQLTGQFRSAGVFGDNLPVNSDADRQTRLLALVGRRA